MDDDSFVQRYEALTKILIPCAEESFGRTPRYKRVHAVTSPRLQAIVASIRNLGGAIRHVKSDFKCSRLTVFPLPSLLEYLVAQRRLLNKELYAEKMAVIFSRAKLQDRNRMIAALHGGSTKKLAAVGGFVSLPHSVSARDDSEKLISDPEYFSTLYGRLPPVTVPKPWLTTPSVLQVKERISSDPFTWPKPASVAQFRALLRKGNQKPSPGPDGWEKWCVKALSDQALSLVLDLHNYVVMNSQFPGNLEDILRLKGENWADDPSIIELFVLQDWPVKNAAAKEALEGMENSHQVIPIRAYDVDGDLISPAHYMSKLSGAVVRATLTLSHWKIGRDKRDTYTADIETLRVLVPVVRARANEE
ncbi:hypothetical protein R3P38DRAFT_3204421 [Favolaschia claudopus]|uniref:Uncharacterized protein n=1 Tax=Favolaschia claudopus TaxID=2862362 RepID=A0AAW0ARQ4_9AGAR